MSRRWLSIVLVAPLALAACGSGSDKEDTSSDGGTTTTVAEAPAGKATEVEVTLTDAGCEPRSISLQAGPVTFKITNESSGGITEFEVLKGTEILGEREGIEKGDETSFSLTLEEGSYTSFCPGGEQFSRGVIEVAKGGVGETRDSAARKKAVADYLDYVNGRIDELQAKVATFADAVKAGDVAKTRQLFAATRAPYEAIEPIAESFGDLDPKIDLREADIEPGQEGEWSGFHKIEKAAFEKGDLSGEAATADQLVADVADLKAKAADIELEPAQIANGAVGLLDEVSVSKITGEEDIFSGTDLSDFKANVDGAKAAFEAVEPLLADAEPDLVKEINTRFEAVYSTLDEYKGTDPDGNGFVLYKTLTDDDTQKLSTALDALAEPLSRVAAIVI